MGLIRRTFSYLDEHLFKQLYTTFVRPHIEYAQSVWSPHLLKHVKQLENVQIRATSQVDVMKKMEYSERLRKLDLPTLLYRRERGDMIEVWKHFNTYTTKQRFHPTSDEISGTTEITHIRTNWRGIVQAMAYEASKPTRFIFERRQNGTT